MSQQFTGTMINDLIETVGRATELRRCDCESAACHPKADCQSRAEVRTLHSKVCVACAAKMPAKYLATTEGRA
jgi:hypothetical protein